jgi:hypothetical protein
VIVAKYGVGAVGNIRLEVEDFQTRASVWCCDVCRLDRGIGWFSHLAVKKMGNGNKIKFWKDVWIGDQSLEVRFPRLFGIFVQQDETVGNIGRWEHGGWRWGLMWRRHFVWEEAIFQQLLDLVSRVIIKEEEDKWIWNPARDEGFSVKSMYVFLDSILLTQNPRNSMESFAFKYIWKSDVPSKVSALSWQVLLDRVSTRANLCY